jgi:peptidoglycan/LPS O-acetylase OafA/YrhL
LTGQISGDAALRTKAPSTAPSGFSYRPDIDGLRALAILPVVLFHAGLSLFSGGFVGVDVFFVISGFLITGLLVGELQRGTFSIFDFYRRRIRRLLPSLAVVLAVTLAVGLVIMTPEDYAKLLNTSAYTLVFGSNFHFAKMGGYFDDQITAAALLHTWSLSVEEQFYLVWPLLLAALIRYAPHAVGRIVGGAMVVMFAVGIIAVYRNSFSAFFLPQTRTWQLLLGAWLAIGGPAPPSKTAADGASLVGLTAIVAAIFLFSADTTYPGWWSLVPTLGAGLVIWSSREHTSLGGRILALKPLVAIGLISYAWYLWHWPLFVLGRYWAMRDLSLTETSGLALLSAGLAVICYRWLEQPIRHGALIPKAWTFAAGGAVTAALLGFSVYGIKTDGFAARYGDRLRVFTAAAKDIAPEFAACRFSESNSTNDDPLCVLRQGQPGQSVVLLWGDSHANSSTPAFLETAKAIDGSVLTAAQGACLPLVGASLTFRTPGHSAACLMRNNRVAAKASTAGVTDVVMAARWNNYLLGPPPYGHEIRARRLYVTDGRTAARSTAENFQLITAALTATVDEFSRRGIRVWLLEEVPYAEQPVANLLARAVINGLPPERLAGVPVEPHRQRAAPLRDLIAKLPAASRPRLLDPSALLCDDTRCRIAEDGQPLYSDTNHLTIRGGRLLSPLAQTVMRAK